MSKNFNKDFNNKKGYKRNGLTSSMLNKYANLNFSYYPGSPLLNDALSIDPATEDIKIKTVPTLLKVDFIPTIGAYGSEQNSPINQAVAQLFAKLRADNAGKVNYSSTDLMIFVTAQRSIYSFHAWGTRILSLINFFSARDFNIPQEFYEAMNVDIDSFLYNRVNLAAYLDSFALNANTLAVPSVFPIIKDDCALCHNVYKLDESNDMGQYLFFEPKGFYKYEENAESGVKFGTLQWMPLPSSNDLTFEEFCAIGDALIRDVKTSEDHYIMCGDIRKSFGTNVLTLDSVNTESVVEPVFDKEILDSLHNANLVEVTPGAITQDGVHETITQEFSLTTVSDPAGFPILLDSVDWDPDPNKVVEMCRWKTVVRSRDIGEGGSEMYIYTSGPQILNAISIYWRNPQLDKMDEHTFKQYLQTNPTTAGIPAINDLYTVYSLRSFIGNVLPFQYGIVTGTDNKPKLYLLGKPRCATIVVDTQLQNINRCKFYMLFGVGQY